MEEEIDIGFIGIGNMGGAMASWIPKAGYSLVVHDLDRDAAEPLLRQGASWADSPRELASQSDVVVSSTSSIGPDRSWRRWQTRS